MYNIERHSINEPMEKNLKLKTSDKQIIYGTLRKPAKQSSTLIIFVHGLTGHQNEHIFFNGARFFEKCGIDTFRFDLYSGEKDGRTLSTCGISTHTTDVNTVAKHFRKKYKTIFVIGHSLGGLSVLASDTSKIDGIILWDASYGKDRGDMDDAVFIKSMNAYVLKWGTEYLMGKKMNDEWNKFPAPKVAIQKIHKPLCVIVAGNGQLVKAGKEYFAFANEPKMFANIKGAGHTFDEDGVEQELFEATKRFVKKFALK